MATKPEVIAQLDAAGIPYDAAANKADLEALLPADLRAADEASDAAEEAAAVHVEPAQDAPVAAEAPVAADSINIDDIILGVEGDTEEQSRLRGVFAAFFSQSPHVADNEEVKKDLLNQIARAGDVTA